MLERVFSWTAIGAVGAVALAACNDSPTNPLGECEAIVDLFPVPVTDASTLFPEVDDSNLFVSFAPGFEFDFYGTSYSGVYLNTNGGLTFGAGTDDFDVAASDVALPGIAVFWGDLDAAEWGADLRGNQMSYQVCTDRLVVRFQQLQDNDDDMWDNTALATLWIDGQIDIEYASILSEDVLIGVFDGSHTDDRLLAVQPVYFDYINTGSGIILFDPWGAGPTHAGELNNRTITFAP